MGYFRSSPLRGYSIDNLDIQDTAVILNCGTFVKPARENNCAEMFMDNQSIDKAIYIGDNVTNCYRMFSTCRGFNNMVYIGNALGCN